MICLLRRCDQHEVSHALTCHQAKNERNYAKFFSILRSPSTPYLFACLMFKHVAHMRKFAIYIIHKTYGGKSKEGTGIQDSYPLKRLTSLLCFEDDEESRAACAHYNITVEEDERGKETIFWKRTSFREPKDPEKGNVIPLHPRKMLKTIESKLNGATRLAVCRGDTSGAGSSLSPDQVQLILSRKSASGRVSEKRIVSLLGKGQNNVFLQARQQQMEDARKKQEEMNQLKERERLLAITKELEERNRRQLEERKQRETEAIIRTARMEQERQSNQLKLEHEVQQRKQEELQAHQEAERQRKMEEERQAVLLREQEIRTREAAEQQRQQEEKRMKQLAAERRRQQLEREAEIMLANEERRKQELLRAQEVDRQHREAEALHALLETKKRLIASWKIGLWIARIVKTQRIRDARRINDSLSLLNSRSPIVSRHLLASSVTNVHPTVRSRQHIWCNQFENCFANVIFQMQNGTEFGKLDTLLLKNVCCKLESKFSSGNRTIALFKIAVIFPQPRSDIERRICTNILSWMQSRLTFFEVLTGYGLNNEVRIFIEDNLNMQPHTVTSDAVIFVVPPPWSDPTLDQFHDAKKLLEVVDDDVPRMLCIFHDSNDSKVVDKTSLNLCHVLAGQRDMIDYVEITSLNPQFLENTMRECVRFVSDMLSADAPRALERWSFIRIIFNSVSSILWNGALGSREDISLHATAVIRSVIGDITTVYGYLEQIENCWPSTEFLTAYSSIPSVPDYFGPNMDLPVNWISYSNGPSVESELLRYARMLSGPFSEVVESFVSDAPYDVRSNCQSMLDTGLVKRSLQAALLWRLQQDESHPDCQYLFLPEGVVSSAIDRGLASVLHSSPNYTGCSMSSHTLSEDENSWQGDLLPTRLPFVADTSNTNDFMEQIDGLPLCTPRSSQKVAAAKRSLGDVITPNGIHEPRLIQSVSLRSSESFLSRKKRQRISVLNEGEAVSMHLSESSSFTKKLEKLLHGSEVVDLIIGNGTSFLFEALEKAPPLITEFDGDQRDIRALKTNVPNYK
jgi:SAC3/GANP family